jgi:hypothetical protein
MGVKVRYFGHSSTCGIIGSYLRILLPVAMISFAIGGGAFEVFGYGCYPYCCEPHALDVIQLWKASQSLTLD